MQDPWQDQTHVPQEYTNVQSLVKCPDHGDIASDTACSQAKVVLSCAMRRNALTASQRLQLQTCRNADILQDTEHDMTTRSCLPILSVLPHEQSR